MTTLTLRKLRHDFGSVFARMKQGKLMVIGKRGNLIAPLTPPPRPVLVSLTKRPDFAARLKRIYGEQVLPPDVVEEERQSRPYWRAVGHPSRSPAMCAYADTSFLICAAAPQPTPGGPSLAPALKETDFLVYDTRHATLAKAEGLKVKS